MEINHPAYVIYLLMVYLIVSGFSKYIGMIDRMVRKYGIGEDVEESGRGM
jgi:hypothetical protein